MPKRKSVFSDELQQKYPCFKKDVAILKLNPLLVDMEHLFLWQRKAVLALMTILKTQNITGIRDETSSFKVTNYFCKSGTKSEDEVAAVKATIAF